jgi:hypothetical protein
VKRCEFITFSGAWPPALREQQDAWFDYIDRAAGRKGSELIIGMSPKRKGMK